MSTTQASPWAVSHALAFTAGNDHVRVSRLGPAPELSVLTANWGLVAPTWNTPQHLNVTSYWFPSSAVAQLPSHPGHSGSKPYSLHKTCLPEPPPAFLQPHQTTSWSVYILPFPTLVPFCMVFFTWRALIWTQIFSVLQVSTQIPTLHTAFWISHQNSSSTFSSPTSYTLYAVTPTVDFFSQKFYVEHFQAFREVEWIAQ